MEIFTKSSNETKESGKNLGLSLKKASVIVFEGDLGAGKTTFIQGLAQGLGVNARINSPTFIIMREYEIDESSNFYHIDLYRLENNIEKELENLGILDLISENKHFFAIEWGEKAIDFLPKDTLSVKFENIDENTRKININR